MWGKEITSLFLRHTWGLCQGQSWPLASSWVETLERLLGLWQKKSCCRAPPLLASPVPQPMVSASITSACCPEGWRSLGCNYIIAADYQSACVFSVLIHIVKSLCFSSASNLNAIYFSWGRWKTWNWYLGSGPEWFTSLIGLTCLSAQPIWSQLWNLPALWSSE